jgi:peptidoglycan hydrolase-like protein with peptidoglycan-binding domain
MEMTMRMYAFPLILAAGLGSAMPAAAQNDIGDILSGVAQTLMAQQADKTAYLDAQRQNSADAYRTYLTQYPQGAYRANAEAALRKLGASVDAVDPPVGNGTASAASVEAAIGLSRADRVELQKQLTSLGYPTGIADGLWGSNTRNAIARWQSANQMTASGYLTARQARLIAEQAGPVADSGSTVAGDDAVEERLLSLTYEERREIQRRLTRLGYSTGRIDGIFGANTRRALASWQRDEGLRASGYITADQLRELRRQTG